MGRLLSAKGDIPLWAKSAFFLGKGCGLWNCTSASFKHRLRAAQVPLFLSGGRNKQTGCFNSFCGNVFESLPHPGSRRKIFFPFFHFHVPNLLEISILEIDETAEERPFVSCAAAQLTAAQLHSFFSNGRKSLANSQQTSSLTSIDGLGPFVPDLLNVVQLFLNAHELAQREQRLLWDFAIEVGDLLRLGLTRHHLRWLSVEGLAEFGEETSRPGKGPRKFQPLPRPVVSFSQRTCCVSTPSGHNFFCRLQHEVNMVSRGLANTPTTNQAPQLLDGATHVPYWDGGKSLYFRDILLHEFKQPAPHEKAILKAFQDAGWLPYVTNPLFMVDPLDRGEKAANAVKKLNEHQDPQLLIFCVVDKGLKAGWRPKH